MISGLHERSGCESKIRRIGLHYRAAMEHRQLGRLGPPVSAIGLGCMSLGIADVYTSSITDDDAAVALIAERLTGHHVS